MRTLPLTAVKAKLSEVIEELSATQERVTVTKNGRPVAVLITTDDLETIEETLDLLADPTTLAEILQGRQAIAVGDVVDRGDLESLRRALAERSE